MTPTGCLQHLQDRVRVVGVFAGLGRAGNHTRTALMKGTRDLFLFVLSVIIVLAASAYSCFVYYPYAKGAIAVSVARALLPLLFLVPVCAVVYLAAKSFTYLTVRN